MRTPVRVAICPDFREEQWPSMDRVADELLRELAVASDSSGAPVHAEAVERLRAGDLVHEVEVDCKDGGRTLLLIDDVLVPDLLDDGLRHTASLPEGETHLRPSSHHFKARWMRADQARSLWSCPGNGVVTTSVPKRQPRVARSASNAA